MAKTACEEAAEVLEAASVRVIMQPGVIKRLRAEGRELKRLRKSDGTKLLKAWVYSWQRVVIGMTRDEALRCIARDVDDYEREAARIQKARKK